MVELVRENEAAFAADRRDVRGVGGEAHAEADRRFDAEKFGDLPFEQILDLEATEFALGRTDADAVAFDRLLYGVGDRAGVRRVTEVIVRTKIDRLGARVQVLERPVVVVRGTVDHGDLRRGHTADRQVPAVRDTSVDVARVEALEVVVQLHVALAVLLGRSASLLETDVTQKVAQMSEQNDQQVGEVTEQLDHEGHLFFLRMHDLPRLRFEHRQLLLDTVRTMWTTGMTVRLAIRLAGDAVAQTIRLAGDVVQAIRLDVAQAIRLDVAQTIRLAGDAAVQMIRDAVLIHRRMRYTGLVVGKKRTGE